MRLFGSRRNLLLAHSSKRAQCFDGFSQVPHAVIFEILQRPAVLDFAFIPENEVSGPLPG